MGSRMEVTNGVKMAIFVEKVISVTVQNAEIVLVCVGIGGKYC